MSYCEPIPLHTCVTITSALYLQGTVLYQSLKELTVTHHCRESDSELSVYTESNVNETCNIFAYKIEIATFLLVFLHVILLSPADGGNGSVEICN